MYQETRVNTPARRMLSMVNRDNVKDVKIKGFEHQTTPFIERSLMSNRNSIVRIIPGVGENGNILGTFKAGFDPQDAMKDPAKCLSGTFCMVSTVQPFGPQWKDTVLAAYPPGSADEQNSVANNKPTVLERFVRVVNYCTDTVKKGKRPMQAHPSWFDWTKMRGGSLGKVKYRFMFQAIIYMASDQFFEMDSSDGKTRVPMVGIVGIDQGASIQEFMEALVHPQNLRLAPDAFNNSNLGPVAELDGIWCYVHSEACPNDPSGAQSKLYPRYYSIGGTPSDSVSPYPLTEDWVRQAWQPWDKLLKWYTMEEQFRLISETFGPDTVNYVFENLGEDFYTSFIPLDIRQKGLGRYASMSRVQGTPRSLGYSAVPSSTAAVPAATPAVSISKVPPNIPLSGIPVGPSAVSTTAPVVTAPVYTAPGNVPVTEARGSTPDAVPMGNIPSTPKEAAPKSSAVSSPTVPPKVRELMADAMQHGVIVQESGEGATAGKSIVGDLGLPPIPTLDDICPTKED